MGYLQFGRELNLWEGRQHELPVVIAGKPIAVQPLLSRIITGWLSIIFLLIFQFQ